MRIVPKVAAVLGETKLGVLARLWHRWAPSFAVPRRVFGFVVYYDFRDAPYYWIASRRHLETMETIFDLLPEEPTAVWDVGCNVGLFSLRAAQMGHAVTAFDISPKALALLERGARRNRFTIRTVPRAFAARSYDYQPPASSRADNQVREATGAGGRHQSITFLDAAAQWGTPQLIKMDIEGGEGEFLASAEFKRWLVEHQITWIVELHEEAFAGQLWKDVPHRLLDSRHAVVNEPRP